MSKIIVAVNPDGSTKIDFEGFEGPSCMDADEKLRALLGSLGVQVEQIASVAKPELHAEQDQQTYQQSGKA